MRFNPLTTRTLTHKNFGMGPKVLATQNAVDIHKGVIDTFTLRHALQKRQFKPVLARSGLILAGLGEHEADYNRALIEVIPLNDATQWAWDFYRDYEDLIFFNDGVLESQILRRQLAEQLFLGSNVLNNVDVLRILTDILALTDHARQTCFMEAIQHVLVFSQTIDLRDEFLRVLKDNLLLTHQQAYVTDFLRNLSDVMALSNSSTTNADFVRALSNLMVLIDDSQGEKTIQVFLESLHEVNRNDGRLLNFTSNVIVTLERSADIARC